MTLVILKSEKSTGYSDFEDAQLFELMKSRTTNPEEAKKAWNEFYNRYSKYLWNQCLRQCRTVPEGDMLAKDIFQNTMQKVYDNATQFDIAKSDGVKGWLSSIAHNEFYDYFRKHHLKFVNEEFPDVPENFDVDDDFIDPELQEKMANLKFGQLAKLLSNLTQREHKILMTYMTFQPMDKPHAHLPDAELEKLCNEFRATPEAIRQIKRRALLKLKKLAAQI